MNWEHIQKEWKAFSDLVKLQWSKLTDFDLQQIQGKRDVLIAKLRERYNITKEEAEKQIMSFVDDHDNLDVDEPEGIGQDPATGRTGHA